MGFLTKGAIAAIGFAAWAYWCLVPYSTPMTPERRKKYGEWGVVAGASEGLGAAWGDELASHGLNVVLIARSEKKMEAVAASIRERRKVQVVTVVADLMAITLEDVEKRVIGDRNVGYFVYNAAYMAGGEFLSQPVEEHLKVTQLNLNSLITMTHPMAEHMKRHGHGGIVLMGSMSGTQGTGFYPTYSSSKSFIESFSRALWYELAPYNIDVLGCVAGATTTPGYLRVAEKAGDSRSTFIEQTSEEVVSECLAATGATGAIATGPLNKLVKILFTRLVPADLAVNIFSDATKAQTQAGAR